MLGDSLQKEKKTPKNGENLRFPIPHGTVKLSGGDHGTRKPTLMRDQPERGEELSGDFRGSSDKSQLADSIIVITSNLEFSSTCRKQKTFPSPMKYIDVPTTTLYKPGRVARKPY